MFWHASVLNQKPPSNPVQSDPVQSAHLSHLITPMSASPVHMENRMLSHTSRSHAGRWDARSSQVRVPDARSTTTPSSATLAFERGKGK